jgi:hypothetical protein
MKRIYQLALLAVALGTLLPASPAHAFLVLATDSPPGSPLTMLAGTTSSSMTASVIDSTAGNANTAESREELVGNDFHSIGKCFGHIRLGRPPEHF